MCKLEVDKPDILAHDKINNESILIEVGITSRDNFFSFEFEKKRK